MKKLILIICLAFAGIIASAQSNGGETLYIIDGVVSTKSAADELPDDVIRNMNVVTGVEKVVVITTHEGREIKGRVIGVQVDKADPGDVVMDKNAPEAPVVIKDMNVVKVSDAEVLVIFKKPDGELSKGKMDSVSPNQIKSIHVLKDNRTDAYKKYGDTSNGVILVELK